MFKNMTLSSKLITLFLLVGILPAAVIGTISLITATKDMTNQQKVTFSTLTAVRDIKKQTIEKYFTDSENDVQGLAETVGTLRQESFEKLEAVQMIKKDQIENYFSNFLLDMEIFARSKDTAELYNQLREYHNVTNVKPDGAYGISSPEYHRIWQEYGENVQQYYQDSGAYDVFMICAPHGHVMYSCAKESDLGTNLGHGRYKDSQLAKLWTKVKTLDGRAVVDFAPYAPSNGAPAAFAGAPIRDKDGKMIGMMAVQMPLDQINNIMASRHGLGETGETYLVGADFLMRSDSYLNPTNHSVIASFKNPSQGRMETASAQKALAGGEGLDVITSYNGHPVLSCYDPLYIEDLTWAIIAEIDVAEAFCPKDETGAFLFEKFASTHGYYDLFLLNPDGYCFYTVAQEADYQTNFINGIYANSGLGRAVQECLSSKQSVISDFAPYAPSNGEPAAFIAQPVLYDGNVELVVALQLPLEAINTVMQQRKGLGESGETYLVGPDKRMRSDSFLDPKGHSVAASFAGNIQDNGVDTEASRMALDGKTGAEIIEDYNGHPVLSAYTPVKFGHTHWALIAEVDEAEAYAGLYTFRTVLGTVGLIAIGLILAIAILVARSISLPINRIISSMQAGSAQVAAAADQVSQASQEMADGASEQAASLEETSASLEQMAAMTQQNANNASNATALAEQTSNTADSGCQAMGRMQKAVNQIKDASNETAKIIKDIDEIAFQTNLLALNAAVEAARAGEAGKGFAVVAEEVRNLAKRSADAARITSELIAGSQQYAANGVAVSNEVSANLNEISSGIGKVTQLVTEMNSASNEQALGATEVNKAMGQIDKVTQGNAASAEESASASEELSAQAAELNDMVLDLIKVVRGAAPNKTQEQTKTGKSWIKNLGRGQTPNPVKTQIRPVAAVPVSPPVVPRPLHSPEKVIPLHEDDMINI